MTSLPQTQTSNNDQYRCRRCLYLLQLQSTGGPNDGYFRLDLIVNYDEMTARYSLLTHVFPDPGNESNKGGGSVSHFPL